MTWYGADPGGIKTFGVAALGEDGTFMTWICSSVDEAMQFIKEPVALGIDCPLWWSSGKGGGRYADEWLRSTYKIHPSTVQSVNSLKGAVVVQGIMLAMMARRSFPSIPITESHPKALQKALGLRGWADIATKFQLDGSEPATEHETDALLGAVAAREGSLGRWTIDLSLDRGPSEIDPKDIWFGGIHYWWPDRG